MKNIFKETCELVEQGARFKIDFTSRTLKVNDNIIIENGWRDEGEAGIDDFQGVPVLQNIEDLYHEYKHSVPTERSESKRFRYFKALKEHELSDEDMLYGISRDLAQVKLELYFLLCVIEGKLVWNEGTMGKWFWQSSDDKDLVILRSWVDKKENN